MKSHSDRSLKKRLLLKERDINIFEDYLAGVPQITLKSKYKLSGARLCVIMRPFKMLIGYPNEYRNFFLAQPSKHAAWLKKVRGVYLK